MTYKNFLIFIIFLTVYFIVYNIFLKGWISVMDLRAYEVLLIGPIIIFFYLLVRFKNKK